MGYGTSFWIFASVFGGACYLLGWIMSGPSHVAEYNRRRELAREVAVRQVKPIEWVEMKLDRRQRRKGAGR
jgi:hypothetical protein